MPNLGWPILCGLGHALSASLIFRPWLPYFSQMEGPLHVMCFSSQTDPTPSTDFCWKDMARIYGLDQKTEVTLKAGWC